MSLQRSLIPAEDPDHLAEVLAIRTLELLKASALRALLEATRPRREIAPPPVADPPNARFHAAEAKRRIGIEAGISASSLGPAAEGETIQTSAGATVGFYAVIPILKSVSFVSELLYVQRYSTRTL